ncbi:MAG: ATPase, T2SS/T4P/T4SS family, partial [Aeromonas veronii]
MNLDDLLSELVERKGSDLFVTVGSPPTLKVNGHLVSLGGEALDKKGALTLVRDTLSSDHFERYIRTKEANYAIYREALGRFRVSAFWQQELPGMVVRRIETRIPTFEDLQLPKILQEVAMAKRGLVLFVGATGAGKSTTQAAMIGYRNQHADGHILTVEDPVEFVHQHGRSLVTQREVGIDTESFDVALKSSLRQAPDVILIGEIRSQETMEFALQFAETGHLCLATLHANNANQALDRILHLVPQDKHRQ